MERKRVRTRVLLQLRIKPELAAKVKAQAAAEDIPMAVWIRHLMHAELDRVGKQQQPAAN